MAINSRQKGKRRELEVIHVLHRHGWGLAERTSDGRSQGSRGDVRNGPEGCHLEIKGEERLSVPAAFDQIRRDARAEDLPVLIHRPSRHVWMATIELDELLPLLALRERGL